MKKVKLEDKYCKKCGKELPFGTKKKYCERCENIRMERLKKIGGIGITGFGLVLTVGKKIKNSIG